MDRLSRASKALHRSSKNLRDSPPGSPGPHRSHFGSLKEKQSKHSRQESMKFQISAPVELISSTSMISYTSKSLRSPSPTGRTASSIGYAPNSATSSPAMSGPMSPVSSPRPQNHILVNQKPYHHQPPSPASASGESIKGPFTPEIGLAISDVLTPPATPPPDHIPRRSRSSSIGKNAAMNATATRQSGSIHRIRSTSSLSSSISAGSSHENYKLDTDETGSQGSDPRRITATFGPPTSYKGPAGTNPRSSNGSTNSNSSFNGASVTSHPVSASSTPAMPPPPPRVTARRSASNPNMKLSQKRSVNKVNPFAHELAQVSELAEDMGIDLVDNDFMIRKGLLKFSAKDYLEVIRDVVFYPSDFSDEEEAKPVIPQQKRQPSQSRSQSRPQPRQRKESEVAPPPIVPARRKPTIPAESPRQMHVSQMQMHHIPRSVPQQQPVAAGGWI
ncbi:hypothetical protein H072_6779 [Dactylellina haptotyla CBS 200.50]|uniref:Uncharacterized protein n=1 Tax=Dactylellina haptotyla (strain CBS 200.50) TaxID=1284197 RepID=S8BJH9_DACHA|nr:hypothetical protein H072_6779 [Dactylellina haptotyla CBS 200.50]